MSPLWDQKNWVFFRGHGEVKHWLNHLFGSICSHINRNMWLTVTLTNDMTMWDFSEVPPRDRSASEHLCFVLMDKKSSLRVCHHDLLCEKKSHGVFDRWFVWIAWCYIFICTQSTLCLLMLMGMEERCISSQLSGKSSERTRYSSSYLLLLG